ncbi:hypothetical protein OIA45_48885 (plasmid) [Streptomyces chartreusis]|uniref:hypothetical protein n=1 Tax=Streptomyces chartreusis TaxID=1969 RepID=UPI0037DC52BF|nr:hypothetical protein OIA45_48885 [Streptomyces chartreusis]
MSAAEPAIPTPPTVQHEGAAVIIDMEQRRTGAHANAHGGRWHRMSTPPTPPEPAGSRNRSPIERVADDVEGWFIAVERTLADEETADVFRRTLDVVDHILNGATAQNIISKEQRAKLDDLLKAIRQAPDLV